MVNLHNDMNVWFHGNDDGGTVVMAPMVESVIPLDGVVLGAIVQTTDEDASSTVCAML